MAKSLTFSMLITALALGGCATQAQFLDGLHGSAMQTAVSRGQFDLNCPQAAPVLLSREVVQPVLQGPFMGPGILRAEYTIGVEGCGRRHTYIVICPEGGSGCYAAGPGTFIGGYR